MVATQLSVDANGGASDRAQATFTFFSALVATRNYLYAKCIVRVGLGNEASNSHLAALYEVTIAQYDDGTITQERTVQVVTLAEAASAGTWVPPGSGGFSVGNTTTSAFFLNLQNLATGTVDVDIQVIESNNVDTITIAKV